MRQDEIDAPGIRGVQPHALCDRLMNEDSLGAHIPPQILEAAEEFMPMGWGRTGLDAWMTKWTFRHVLLRRAYTKEDLARMAQQSRFGSCEFSADRIGAKIRFAKPESTRQ